MNYKLNFWILTAFIIFSPLTALSAETQIRQYEDPEELVNELLDEVVEFNQRPNTTNLDKYHFYRQLANQYMDVETIALTTLGTSHRRRLTEEQKSQFIPLFEDYVILKIIEKMSPLLKGNLKFQKVKTQILKPGYYRLIYEYTTNGKKSKKEIMWTVIKPKNRSSYKIYDFHIEGVSLLLVERKIFNDVLLQTGIDGLIDKLKEWIEDLSAKHL